MLVRFRPGAHQYIGDLLFFFCYNIYMAESEHDKLNELLDLTKENNRILRGMHRGMIWGQVFTFLYWLFILGVMGWSYLYIQPYLNKYWGTFQQAMATLNELEQSGKTLPDNIQKLIAPR